MLVLKNERTQSGVVAQTYNPSIWEVGGCHEFETNFQASILSSSMDYSTASFMSGRLLGYVYPLHCV